MLSLYIIASTLDCTGGLRRELDMAVFSVLGMGRMEVMACLASRSLLAINPLPIIVNPRYATPLPGGKGFNSSLKTNEMELLGQYFEEIRRFSRE